MALFIDDIPVPLTAATLGELLHAATHRLEPSGRVVVEVLIDDEPVVGDALDRRSAEPLSAATMIRLTTADPRELVVETLAEIRRQLDNAGQLQQQAADELQRDNQVGALKNIGDAMMIWQQTEQAVRQSATILDVPLQDLSVDGVVFTELTTNLVKQLSQLRDLLQASDTVAMADTLAYEWPTTIQRWQILVDRLIETVRA